MTNRLDLPLRYRRIVEALLREHVPEAEVWAYGSRVNGESHEASDLDLVVRGPGLEPLSGGFLNLLEAIEESNIPILVQTHDWARLSEGFHQEIERNHMVVQKEVSAGSADLSGEWRELPFRDAVLVNPAVRLERGLTYPFVDMAAVNADSRSAYSSEQREFRGGGSRFHNGDTLMARVTPCLENGKIARYHSPEAVSKAHGSTEFIVIRGRPDVTNNDFAYYLTKWNEVREYAISQMTGTSGRQRVPADSLYHLTVPIPPLSEQRAIAHVLGTLDDKIELNRRMNETLEEMARALFKSWFVDFDPVRAKMDGRWRRGESLPGLPAEHYDLFPDRLVPSESGEIPEGWEVRHLGDVVKLNPTEPIKRGALAPYLDMAALPTSGPSPDEAMFREFKSGTRFRNGDTLLARITPCLENGKTAFVQSLQEDTVGWGSTEFIVMRAIPPVPPEYTYLLARDLAFRAHAIQSMTGTSGRQRARTEALAPYPLPSPPADVWTEFSSLAGPVFTSIELSRKESQALVAQRDALLPKLVSGEARAEKEKIDA